MHFGVFIISLILLPCCVVTSASWVQDQDQRADAARSNAGPVVEDFEPKTAAINSVVELRGYRLHPDVINKAKVFFTQHGVELPARSRGGASITNDQQHGPQTLEVIVPEEVVPGVVQIVVEVDGHRTIPATVTITEWKLPIIKRISPTRGAPGSWVHIQCEGFHINDEIEIVNAEGTPIRFDSGGSSVGTAFAVPKDTPEGVLTIRIGNKKYGRGQYTEPFTFIVTNDPLPPELVTSAMKSVAPGQWLDLVVYSDDPLKHSERIEVSFKQTGRQMIVAAPKPWRPHIAVPGALSPGEVELKVRTWRDGRPSEWSEPGFFFLADKPLAPSVGAIRLLAGSWVQLWPGPDRPKSFAVSPADEIVLNGIWPVADASKLTVSLVRAGEAIPLTATELDEKADWFNDVRVRLPQSLDEGEWRMIVSGQPDGTQHELPIVIRVVKK